VSLLRQAIEREFNPKQVGIAEFAESNAFCGKQLYPRQRALLKLFFLEEMNGYEEDVLDRWIRGEGGVHVSPYIRERREWLRDNGYRHFPEVILVGGRRSSKGFVTAIALTKLIYDVQQLGDPGSFYGIDPQKEIYFTSVAASLEQAKQYQFADLVSTISQCRPLIDQAKVQEEGIFVKTPADERLIADLKARGVKVGRDYSKLRVKPLAANADTIRGSTTYAIVFDEMAFMLPGESRSSAEQCYQAAKPALAQFGRDAMVFLNSSPYTKVGAFYDRFELANQTNGEEPTFPELMSFTFPSWELYRDYRLDPLQRFRRVGAIMVDPEAADEGLTENDKAKRRQAQLEEIANPEAFKVERRAAWAEVIDAYLNPAMVDRAFAPTYMGTPIKMTKAGTYAFIYKGHCDPSSTTAGFGLAIAHVEEFPDEINPDSGQMAKHVVFDLVKRWNPRDFPGSTIDYMRVQQEIAEYITLYQPMYEFSFDQYNSQAPMQWLRGEMGKRRFRTVVKEVVATKILNWNRWETFKTALNLGLIHIPQDCPDSEYAALELKFLQEENGKVIKQDLGPVTTKDIADCICEVAVSLIGTQVYSIMGNMNQSLVMGSQGGYQMGGRDGSGPASFGEFYQSKRPGGSMRTRGRDLRRGR
jgi:hypothetical protein